MKKIFNLIVSFVLLAGFSACNKDGSDKPGLPPAPVPTVNYKGLTFISSGNSTVCLAKVGTPDEITLEYSTDESQWNPYTIGEKISLADGTFLLFRAGEQKNLTFSKGSDSYYHFEISGPVTAQGNIMSLLDRDFSTPLSTNAFFALFEGCTSLLSAPELPATTMAQGCYFRMFAECTGLKSAPELPATTMAQGCYFRMFAECTGLKSAPELPAEALAYNCYGRMFKGCSALTYVPDLPATKMEAYCYNSMFANCTSLKFAPELPAKRLESNCYQHMFEGCTSLTSAPELPATELVSNCYEFMYKDCHNLRYVIGLFTTEPSEKTTKDWLSGVAASGTFIKSKKATWDVTGAHGIPEGWKIETW